MIKLELNSTDELALRHMGNALTAMASEIKNATSEVSRLREVVESEPYVEEPTSVASTEEPVKPDVTFTISKGDGEPMEIIDDKLDSNGLPWDGRIHSSSKAKIKDGSWKKRKGVDAETLATVEAELTALMSIPVGEPLDPKPIRPVETVTGVDTSTECETQDVTASTGDVDIPEAIDEKLDEVTPPPPAPIVPKHQDVTPPPPPVVDAPVGNTPDAVEAVSFVEITRFITGTMVKEMGWKIPEVNALLTEQYGVTFATLKAREDLFDTVFTFLKGQPSK